MPEIIGVRFQRAGKVYTFSPAGNQFRKGDGVIVETSRGVEFGTVVEANREVDDASVTQPLKEILRKATEEDLAVKARNKERVDEALAVAREKIRLHNLDMKLVDCEFTFDGSKVVFYFTAEERVDFRDLVRDLASVFRIRIELRQIGIRDEAKMRGGLAPCGLPCCCSYHLPDFKRVSIKMAKTQGLSLNPGKISGLCGRLMCCLEYENPHYAESAKVMPKIGAEVQTVDGIRGIAVSNNLLKLVTRVKYFKDDGSYEFKDYEVKDLRFGANRVAVENEDDEEDASGEGGQPREREDRNRPRSSEGAREGEEGPRERGRDSRPQSGRGPREGRPGGPRDGRPREAGDNRAPREDRPENERGPRRRDGASRNGEDARPRREEDNRARREGRENRGPRDGAPREGREDRNRPRSPEGSREGEEGPRERRSEGERPNREAHRPTGERREGARSGGFELGRYLGRARPASDAKEPRADVREQATKEPRADDRKDAPGESRADAPADAARPASSAVPTAAERSEERTDR